MPSTILLVLIGTVVILALLVAMLLILMREQSRQIDHIHELTAERFGRVRTRLHHLEAFQKGFEKGLGLDPAGMKGLHAQMERLNQTLDNVTESGNAMRTVITSV